MRFQAIPLNAPAFDNFARHLAATHGNGGLVYARFRAVDVTDGRSILPDGPPEAFAEALLSFLNSGDVGAALPQLGLIGQEEPTAQPLGFSRSPGDGLTLDGEFAQVLVEGGAYELFNGQPSKRRRPASQRTRDSSRQLPGIARLPLRCRLGRVLLRCRL